MRTTYKYPIAITDKQTMILPAGAEFLSVQVQNNNLYAWKCGDRLLKHANSN